MLNICFCFVVTFHHGTPTSKEAVFSWIYKPFVQLSFIKTTDPQKSSAFHKSRIE